MSSYPGDEHFDYERDRRERCPACRDGECPLHLGTPSHLGAPTNRVEAQRLVEETCRFNCDAESSCDCSAHRLYRHLLAQLDALSTEHAKVNGRLADARSVLDEVRGEYRQLQNAVTGRTDLATLGEGIGEAQRLRALSTEHAALKHLLTSSERFRSEDADKAQAREDALAARLAALEQESDTTARAAFNELWATYGNSHRLTSLYQQLEALMRGQPLPLSPPETEPKQ